jgi:hypothetical protein
LARAVSSERVDGSLSGLVDRSEINVRDTVLASLRSLPSSITSYDFRDIVPVMSALATVVKGNFINLEALAAAIAFACPIVVSTESPLLSLAAEKLHIQVLIVPVA